MKSNVRNRALDPSETFAGDVFRDFVIAVELAERDVVAFAFEFAGDATAATVDRKNVIVRTVRDENTRLAVRIAVNYKTR
jgi:hypothetical protein